MDGGEASVLAVARFLAQLFAAGFAPWADRRRSLRLFRRLSGRLLSDIEAFVSVHEAAGAAGADVGVARRAASDSAECLCELIASCAMRLQLEAREAPNGFTRRALEGLRDATLGLLSDALADIHDRFAVAGRGALTPRATGALDALLAFQLAGWELSDTEPGVPALGIPDARIARLVQGEG
jgi:uncharacterized protein YjiS (DUF1127 family)